MEGGCPGASAAEPGRWSGALAGFRLRTQLPVAAGLCLVDGAAACGGSGEERIGDWCQGKRRGGLGKRLRRGTEGRVPAAAAPGMSRVKMGSTEGGPACSRVNGSVRKFFTVKYIKQITILPILKNWKKTDNTSVLLFGRIVRCKKPV
jgi:hypothetical protein